MDDVGHTAFDPEEDLDKQASRMCKLYGSRLCSRIGYTGSLNTVSVSWVKKDFLRENTLKLDSKGPGIKVGS